MIGTRCGVRFRAGVVVRGAVAILLLAALSLGVLPFSVEQPLLAAGTKCACRFEPIDVCGAGDTSLGMLADTPVLLAEAVAVLSEPATVAAAADAPAVIREGFAPGVYRPPRPSC